MKILIAAFCPLDASYGAAQLALNLAGALRERGHEVVTWSPGVPPARLRWWRDIAWKRSELERFLAGQPPFDVIDAPPVAITPRVSRSAPTVIARSVQPDLRYLYWEIAEAVGRLVSRPLRSIASIVSCVHLGVLVAVGWHRADSILCLGSDEETWMRRRFPWLRARLAHYWAATAKAERAALLNVRTCRQPAAGAKTRFLWIGRWAPHKGTRLLLRFIAERGREHPDDSFTIAGFGVGAEQEVDPELLAKGRVRLVPSFDRGELPGLLAGHDVGLFTSRVEGWGLTLNEMLESGMPILCTSAGGVLDLEGSCGRAGGESRGAECFGLRYLAPPNPDDYASRFTWETIALAYCAHVARRQSTTPST